MTSRAPSRALPGGLTALGVTVGILVVQRVRTINLNSIEATYKGTAIVGINTNYGGSVTLRNITIVGDSGKKIVPCQKYTGNNTGKEPTKNGSGPDGTYCKYASSDITYK
ncbi:hypothetical protein Scel_79230 [Streptomyces cellostaticus]|nr:hypothetical protein Scel_79230 [Streptomyces cellostaticus]